MDSLPLQTTLPKTQELELTDNQVTLALSLPADLAVFKGHFPDYPVLPGVVQLHWAVLLSRSYFGELGNDLAIDKLKFQNIIQPGDSVSLVLSRTSQHAVKFTYLTHNQQASSGLITFTRS